MTLDPESRLQTVPLGSSKPKALYASSFILTAQMKAAKLNARLGFRPSPPARRAIFEGSALT